MRRWPDRRRGIKAPASLVDVASPRRSTHPVRTFPAALLAAALLVGSVGAALAQADVEDGRKLFNKCKVCHTLDPGKNGVGPSLSGVLGRKAASVENYKYSPAM